MSHPDKIPAPAPHESTGSALRTAVREARIEAAERTGVVVDLRDAELARLEILNEALDPVFAALPADIDIFDRGIVPGASPRLWIDVLAHVSMGRDKRVYRFVQDTRYGRRVLVESAETKPVVDAVTRYVARRMVERERALAADTMVVEGAAPPAAPQARRRPALRSGLYFAAGILFGVAALFTIAWFVEPLI